MRSRIAKLTLVALCAAAVVGLSAVSPRAHAQASPFQPLHSFDEDVFSCFTCVLPPVLGQAGVLYGLTNSGGANQWGTLYRIGADGAYLVLHDFGGKAWIPEGQPVQVPNGDLWGVTSDETARPHEAHGTLWRVTASGQFRIMDTFVGTNGAYPNSLVLAPDGHLYGIATAGGAYGKGLLFTVDGTGHVQPVYSFSARTGAITPYMELTAGSDGAFYGVAYGWRPGRSARVAWRYGADGTFTILHQFGADYLAGGVIEGPDGALYGQTWYGDESNPHGTVYRLAKDGSRFTVLHTFDGTDGDQPGGLLSVDAAGRLVGATMYGGLHRFGNVFRLGLDGSGFTTLYDFDATGGSPTGINLAADGQGYGAAGSGGANAQGAVFRLTLPDY